MVKLINIQMERPDDRQLDQPTGRQTDRQLDRLTDRQTNYQSSGLCAVRVPFHSLHQRHALT